MRVPVSGGIVQLGRGGTAARVQPPNAFSMAARSFGASTSPATARKERFGR